MPVIMQVNYTCSDAQYNQPQEEIVAAAENVKTVEGLIWKVWIYNRAERQRGGLYLFDTIENAKNCGEGNTRKVVTEAGATDISIRYFDVNEAASLVTRAHLSA